MEQFDSQNADKTFNLGRRYLDSGRFNEAIEIYSKLISDNQKFQGNSEVNILLETSLNNLGCAKCRLAKYKNDRTLYEDGMKNFNESIKLDPSTSQIEHLTAYGNLKWAEEEIKRFTEKGFEGDSHDKDLRSVS